MRNPFPIKPSQTLASLTSPLADYLNLTILPLHIHEILISAIAYHILYKIISPSLSKRFLPKAYAGLDKRTRLNWNVHVVSLVQSTLINVLALWVMFFDKERKSWDWQGRVYGYDGAVGLVASLACGYFLWDTIMTATHVSVFGPGMMAHALSALAVYGAGFRPFVVSYAPVFILFELSSPFLNFHWFFDKLGMTGSNAQLVNGILLMSTFAGGRLVWGSYNCFRVFPDMLRALKYQRTAVGQEWFAESYANATAYAAVEGAMKLNGEDIDAEYSTRVAPKTVPEWYVGLYMISYLTLMILNFYWFGKMIETLRARFDPPLGTRGVKGKERRHASANSEATSQEQVSTSGRKIVDDNGHTMVELEENEIKQRKTRRKA